METAPCTTLNSRRWDDIDTIKGLLVICVVAGHYILGPQMGTFLRHCIYSLHMPLFIGFAGFLLKRVAVQRSTFCGFVSKYGKRILIPWLFAYLYYVVIAAMRANPTDVFGEATLTSITYNTHFLYYHLWYVPGILVYFLYAWVTTKCRLPGWLVWTITMIIALTSATGLLNSLVSSPGWLDTVIASAKHNLRLYNLGFFMLGYTLGNREAMPKLFKHKAWYAFSVLPMLVYFSLYFKWYQVDSGTLEGLSARIARVMQTVSSSAEGVDWSEPSRLIANVMVGDISWWLYQVANMALLITVLAVCTQNQFKLKSNFISWMGRNSLPLYLWHIAIKNIFMKYATPEVTLYYGLAMIGFLLLCLAIYYVNKVPVLSALLCGNPMPKRREHHRCKDALRPPKEPISRGQEPE